MGKPADQGTSEVLKMPKGILFAGALQNPPEQCPPGSPYFWGCFALARAALGAFPSAADAPPPRGLSCSGTRP